MNFKCFGQIPGMFSSRICGKNAEYLVSGTALCASCAQKVPAK